MRVRYCPEDDRRNPWHVERRRLFFFWMTYAVCKTQQRAN